MDEFVTSEKHRDANGLLTVLRRPMVLVQITGNGRQTDDARKRNELQNDEYDMPRSECLCSTEKL